MWQQMHGGGAKKGGSGTDKVINDEPSKRGGAIGGKRGGKASGTAITVITVKCDMALEHLQLPTTLQAPAASTQSPCHAIALQALSNSCLRMDWQACCIWLACSSFSLCCCCCASMLQLLCCTVKRTHSCCCKPMPCVL